MRRLYLRKLRKIRACQKGTENDTNSSSIRIFSVGGKVEADNTRLISLGNLKVQGTDGVTLNNSVARAENTVDSTMLKNTEILSSGDIKAHNSIITGTNDVTIKSFNTANALTGDIILSSDLNSNGQNQSIISAGNKLSIQGTDTKIDNVGLVYQDLKFYNDNTTGTNNVTIANNTTFTPITYESGSKKISRDVNVETNGNLINKSYVVHKFINVLEKFVVDFL